MQTINTDHIRTEFSTSADENIRSMKKQIRIEENFDILTREIIIGGKKAGFFFIGRYDRKTDAVFLFTQTGRFIGCGFLS